MLKETNWKENCFRYGKERGCTDEREKMRVCVRMRVIICVRVFAGENECKRVSKSERERVRERA